MPNWKKNVFRTESEMLSALKASIFHAFFLHWKWNAFSLILPYFSCIFFTNSENATKSKFRQETLNILNALKFTWSHLVFYDWKVSFSLISRIIFFSLILIILCIFSALKVKCFKPYFSCIFLPTVKMLQNPNLGRKCWIFYVR